MNYGYTNELISTIIVHTTIIILTSFLGIEHNVCGITSSSTCWCTHRHKIWNIRLCRKRNRAYAFYSIEILRKMNMHHLQTKPNGTFCYLSHTYVGITLIPAYQTLGKTWQHPMPNTGTFVFYSAKYTRFLLWLLTCFYTMYR